jgi:phage-related protein
MRNIDTDIWNEIRKEEYMPFLMFVTTIDGETYRYTDCDVKLVLGGNVYTPKPFKISDVRYSSARILDSVDITFTNLDDVMASIFIEGNPKDADTTLSMVSLELDGRYQPIGDASLTLFEGKINSWDLDEESLEISISTPFSRWNQRTIQRHSSTCRWKVFKGTECGYSGDAADCDRTYARCTALGNTDNFGGFRWLPSIMDKEIWWGRYRSV